MGKFFTSLKTIGFTQKDQITIVQNLFNTFNVDWKEGDRDNIKISLQHFIMRFLCAKLSKIIAFIE